MILKSVSITDKKPGAFKDRDDINYVILTFSNMEFLTWGSTTIVSQFQVPKGYKDLGDILWHMFNEIIPIDYRRTFIVSVRKDLLEESGLDLNAGVYKRDEVKEDYYEWDMSLYKKEKHGRIK